MTKEFRLFLLLLMSVPPMTSRAQAQQPASPSETKSPDKRFKIAEVLFQDDFREGLEACWFAELEQPGQVEAKDGKLIFDVPAGCTLWFKPLIRGAMMIEYKATVIKAGGANDRVSDLNCFWMARDGGSPGVV